MCDSPQSLPLTEPKVGIVDAQGVVSDLRRANRANVTRLLASQCIRVSCTEIIEYIYLNYM